MRAVFALLGPHPGPLALTLIPTGIETLTYFPSPRVNETARERGSARLASLSRLRERE